MKIPVRVIGVVTLILWVFLIIFAVSAVYSIRDIHFSIGEVEASVNAADEAVFSLPIAVVNNGYYDLESLNFSTRVMNEQGETIVYGCTFIPVVRVDENVEVIQETRLNLSDLWLRHESLLFNDSELFVDKAVSMLAFKIVPVQASTNGSLFWGAPLYGFRIGEPQFRMPVVPESGSFAKVFVPLSFENHAFFDLGGQVLVRICNSANVPVGEGEVIIDVPRHSSFYGVVELGIFSEKITRRGYLQVFFKNSLFSYGPLVIPYDV